MIDLILQVDTPNIDSWAAPASYTKQEWGGRHGIPFVRSTVLPEKDFAPAWLKVAVLVTVLKQMDEGKRVWLTDADLCVTNMTRKPHGVFGHMKPISDLLVMHDGVCWNTGSIVVKNSEKMRAWLMDVWCDRYKPYPLWEQDSMISRQTFIEYQEDKPNADYNVYANRWFKGDFTAHLTGISRIPRDKMTDYTHAGVMR